MNFGRFPHIGGGKGSRSVPLPVIPPEKLELAMLCKSLRLCQDTLLTFESLSDAVYVLLNPSKEFTRDLNKVLFFGDTEREIVREVLKRIREKNKSDPSKVSGRTLRCEFAENFLRLSEKHQRRMRWLCIPNEKIEKILHKYLTSALKKFSENESRKVESLVESWVRDELATHEEKKRPIARIPKSESDHYLYEVITAKKGYCPSSKKFSDLLGERLAERINEKDSDEESVNRLCRMHFLCLAFDTVSISPWAKENFAPTLARLWDETTLVLRRADVTSAHKKDWEAFLGKRMELYADLIRITATALNSNPDSPVVPDSLAEIIEEVYRGKMNPLALRRDFQRLGAALSTVIEDYRQFVKGSDRFFSDVEYSLHASRELWNEANFAFSRDYVSWHDELLNRLKRRNLSDPEEVKDFEVNLRRFIHGVFTYLTTIHEVIYPWADSGSAARVSFPAKSKESDAYYNSDAEFQSYDELAREITTSKRGYVLEFTPFIPVRDGLLDSVCDVQKERMIDHSKGGKQEGFYTTVSKEELREALNRHKASLFTVHRPNGHVIGGFLQEKTEELFSDYGRVAVEASANLEELKNCERMFLEVVATRKGELVRTTENGDESLPFDLIHRAVETSCANDGDLLKDKVVLAWVREDNDVFEKYRRRGWVVTELTREFYDTHPETREKVPHNYKLIYLRVRTVDNAIRELFERSGIHEEIVGDNEDPFALESLFSRESSSSH